jgi:hypothetical protein
MSSVDREQVSRDRKIADHADAPLKAARVALCEAESALATAMIEMAEANCKGIPQPERHLQEIQHAYRDAAKKLDDLRTVLPSPPGQAPSKGGGKSDRNPI